MPPKVTVQSVQRMLSEKWERFWILDNDILTYSPESFEELITSPKFGTLKPWALEHWRAEDRTPWLVNQAEDIQQYASFPELYEERKYTQPYARPTLGFMDLPAEIRLNVYRCLLHSERPFELWPGLDEADATWSHYVSFRSALPVLRLNKKIHIEATPVFYGENEFRFSGIGAYLVCKSFFMTIGDNNVRFLRKLTLPIPTITFAKYDSERGVAYRFECASWGDDDERDIVERVKCCGMTRPYENICFSESLDAFDNIIETLDRLGKDDDGVDLGELQLIVPCTLYYPHDYDHENEKLCQDVNSLKGSIKDLRISLVLHHHGFFRKMKQVYGHTDDLNLFGRPIQDQCRSARVHRAWLLNLAMDMDWSLHECHGLDDEHGGYQVLEAGSIVDDTVTGWTVSEPGPDSDVD